MRLVMGLAAGLLAASVQATEFPPEGGKGGVPYRVTCPAGAYVVGVAAFTGDWVDRMQLICAPFADGSLGQPRALPHVIGDSPGGIANAAQCAAGSAVYRVAIGFTEQQSNKGFLETIEMQCKDMQSFVQHPGPAYAPVLGSGGTRGWNFGAVFEKQICPEDEIVVGIHGKAGMFIDSMGLICGRVSRQSGPGIAMGRGKSGSQRAVRAAGAGSQTVGAAGSSRAAARPDISAQAMQTRVDCGQPNSAVSQVGGNLPGAAPRSGTDASPSTPFTRGRPNNSVLPGGAVSSASAAPPQSSATNVGVSASTQSARPVAAPCATGTAAATPPPAPASTPEPQPPGAQPPARPPPGTTPPKPQVPRGRLSREIHPGDRQ